MDTIGDCSRIFPGGGWLFNNVPAYQVDRRMHFRREFELQEVPATVVIRVTADARYTLYVNGEWVSHGPARGICTQWQYDEIDIAPLLRQGKNVIAALLYHYGVSNYSYIYAGTYGFMFSGRAGEVALGTDEGGWLHREAPGYISGVGRCAGQYSFWEYFDCRKGENNWMATDYIPGDDWVTTGPGETRMPGAAPWTGFAVRSFPRPVPEMFHAKLVKCGKAETAEDVDGVAPLREYLQKTQIDWGANEKSAKIFCFEHEVLGHLNFEIYSPQADAAVDFFCFEAFKSDGTPWMDASGQTLYGGRLYLDKGINRHELTLPWGMLAVLFIDRHCGGNLEIKTSMRETVYPLDVRGTFQSGDEILDNIWKICLATQRRCMFDAYVDGPWRECAQWWGDALVQAANTFALSADDRLLVRGHELMAAQTLPNGLTYGVAPAMAPRAVLPDYSAMFLLTLYAHYYQTGSPEEYRKHRQTALGIVRFFDRESAGGLMPVDRRFWFFIDWCPDLDKLEVYNLLALCALDRMKELAVLENDREMTELCAACADRIAGSLTLQEPSPHAVAMAVLCGRFAGYHEQWKNEVILPLLASDHKGPRRPGPYFMHYIFEAAKILKCDAEVIDAIRRWWGEFLDMGLPNTPEHWPEDFDGGNSRCHAWSAHPMVHFRDILLGVKQAAPGWDVVRFEPLGVEDKIVTGTIPTPHGNIEVSVDRRNGAMEKKILLPNGIKLV